MPSTSFASSGSPSNSESYIAEGGFLTSNVATVPAGRAMANGATTIRITGILVYVSGRGGNRVVSCQIGGIKSADWTTTAAGNAVSSGYRSVNTNANPGTYQVRINSNGPIYFGRGGGGDTTSHRGYTWDTGLSGGFTWAQAPSAPRNLTAVANTSVAGRVRLDWDGPSDNGGLSITGYAIYKNGSFVRDVGGAPYDINDQTPGTSATWTVRARNALTDSLGTESVNSNSASATPTGAPSAPRSPAAVSSTTVPGRITVSWTAPATTVGTITGYNVYNQTLNQVVRTNGTGLSYTFDDLGQGRTYQFMVAARNSWTDSNNAEGARSGSVTADSPSVPAAPTALTAVASQTVSGQITLNWTAPPARTGAGAVTGYNIFFGTEQQLVALTGTGTTYTATGLLPGQQYTFYVQARNALSDASGQLGLRSNIATATATGEPTAPTGLVAQPSTVVAGRLTLTWNAPGTVTGYKIYRWINDTTQQLLRTATGTSVVFDGLTAGREYAYAVRATNAVTDSAGTVGGPLSNVAVGVPGATSDQPIAATAISNNTNGVFNGTRVVNTMTANSITYQQASPNISLRAVAAGQNLLNATNTALNGSSTITVASATTFTIAKTVANVPVGTSVPSGESTNLSNIEFNGTFAVTAVTPANRTVSYANSGVARSSVAASGTVTNRTNVIYNGTGLTITDTTSNTLKYAKTGSNAVESVASGLVSNRTHIDVYNGVYGVVDTPNYNTVTYARTAANQATATMLAPYGAVSRTMSPATLTVRYRPGWAG